MRTMNPKKLAGTVLALGLATSAVVAGSTAMWSATTTNPTNKVTAATFALTNSKDSAAVFTAATDVKPGSSNGAGEAVVIKNDSSIPMDVKLSQANPSAANALSGALQLQIFDGTNCIHPAAAGACTGFGAWDAALANVGLGTFAAGAQKTYTVKWELPTSTTGGMGQSAQFDLVFAGAQA